MPQRMFKLRGTSNFKSDADGKPPRAVAPNIQSSLPHPDLPFHARVSRTLPALYHDRVHIASSCGLLKARVARAGTGPLCTIDDTRCS
jgi:hypothetical protein